ncbi:hypothetical protein WICMUC_004414 [Wickerhamomyces mucosus]|uniref:Uncharacterized protein n=1 Tax=Wickerhamomyces mucosus TaxID=1378264 RepID=A0A9P8TBA3_9ASCO|nr:hypothetical protein WICMUC_004414 [Wickerhamomyces mucosus]
MLIKRGLTTNEELKWDDIHYLVNNGLLFQFNYQYYEYLPLEKVFVSVDQKNSAAQKIDFLKAIEVTDIGIINNVYDLGSFWKNLEKRLS